MKKTHYTSSRNKSFLLLGFISYSGLVAGYLLNNFFAGLTLVYFYYSVFTLWHELAHDETREDGDYLNDLLGTIAISPLLIHNYQTKRFLHLLHHSNTNNPIKDPDYNANNLDFSSKHNINRGDCNKVASRFMTVGISTKIMFILFTIAWSVKYSLSLFICCSGISYGITHFIVNIYPHYQASKSSRDLGGGFFITLLMLGNNYHASHHKRPHLHWSYFLKNEKKN